MRTRKHVLASKAELVAASSILARPRPSVRPSKREEIEAVEMVCISVIFVQNSEVSVVHAN